MVNVLLVTEDASYVSAQRETLLDAFAMARQAYREGLEGRCLRPRIARAFFSFRNAEEKLVLVEFERRHLASEAIPNDNRVEVVVG